MTRIDDDNILDRDILRVGDLYASLRGEQHAATANLNMLYAVADECALDHSSRG